MKKLTLKLAVLLTLAALAFSVKAEGHYKNFTVSTYMTQSTVQSMMNGEMDPAVTWSKLTRNLKIDKMEPLRNRTLTA